MRTGGKRTASVFLLLTALLLLLFYCNLALGTRFFSPAKLFSLLSQGRGNDPAVSILFKIRLPRALMALLLGGALAVSGFLLQTYFANPIAGPFVLGVSSGARTGHSVPLRWCSLPFWVRWYLSASCSRYRSVCGRWPDFWWPVS